jgi:hypothetical protein
MVRAMARGGKRDNAGRKPLIETKECRWVVNRVRKLGNNPSTIQKRKVQFIKRRDKDQTQNQLDLQENYLKLGQANITQHRAMIADEVGTPLEETRQILATDGFPRYLALPPPNQFQMHRIYVQVAKEAGRRFKKPTTVRNVKDCVQAWLKYEKSFDI